MLLLAAIILVAVGAAVCASRATREGLRRWRRGGRRGGRHGGRHSSGGHDLLHLGGGQYYGPWASPSWLNYGYGGLYGGPLRGYGGRYAAVGGFQLCQGKCTRRYRACKDAAFGSRKRKARCKARLADCVDEC
uniref:Uncharacterized protein n=1 Tax=Marseillevirus LCMAC103 TaxID=2506604 RepID=A0A481YWP2_9VIRU|nr:MAG: uncharacterized protein LCMAC103_02880 [Marseillevirus LCMAC103]